MQDQQFKLRKHPDQTAKPAWAVKQDKQEKVFAGKHPGVQRQIIDDFYYWLNQDPRENTWECFVQTLKGKGYRQGIVKDVYDCFVHQGDMPGKVSIYKSVA
ncbi:unnamed protein product [marine sediment metagenome]|uniref:Uncharacterized protein n=1 Tax=marine sediment metagenome TaxID=412755 RepID=X1RYN4_9ZZZZ